MISLGKRLKTIREERKLNLNYVSNETNISSKYLEALENEDFSFFPSESYILGYLKSYGEYLGLEQEEILFLYRSLRIQDQPIPMEALLRGPSRLPKILGIFGIILGILVLGAGAYFFIMNFPWVESELPPEDRIAREHIMITDSLERRFYPGDSILLNGDTDHYELILASIGDAVTISSPRGPLILDLSQEVTVDIGDSGFTRLRITAVDFVRNDSLSGVHLRIEQENLYRPVTTDQASMELDLASASVSIIFNTRNPMPFTLQAQFQNYCYFRYEVLFEQDRTGQNERYYQRSEEISVTAQNGVRLGISNAQAVRLQAVIGGRTFPFEAGGAGEIVAADLRWIRAEDNSFSLALLRLE